MSVCFFFFAEVRSRRMSSYDPRGWGHLPKALFASCRARSWVSTHSPNFPFGSFCQDSKHHVGFNPEWMEASFIEWFPFIIEPTCPKSPHPCQRLDIGAAAGCAWGTGNPFLVYARNRKRSRLTEHTQHKRAIVLLTLSMLLVLSHHAGNLGVALILTNKIITSVDFIKWRSAAYRTLQYCHTVVYLGEP